MTRYKLVNANRGDEILAFMHDYIHSLLTDSFSMPNELNLEGDDYDNLHKQLMKEHDVNLTHVECCNSNQSTSQLNSFLTDDVLSIDEALFCILGLNITSKPNNFSILELGKQKSNKVLDSVISNTSEHRKLTRAIIANKDAGLTLVQGQYICTEKFISWAIEKGYIKEYSIDEVKDNNISKFNNDRAYAKKHNAKVIKDAFNRYKTKVDTANSFMDNKSNYDKYKSDLIPMSEDGKLPSIGTLKSYLYDTNK